MAVRSGNVRAVHSVPFLYINGAKKVERLLVEDALREEAGSQASLNQRRRLGFARGDGARSPAALI